MSPLLIGVIVAAIMVVGADVLVPLALAGLLSFALAGPVRALQRVGFPRPVAVVAVVVFAFAVIFGLGEMLASEVGELSDDLPRYEAAIQDKIEGLRREGRSAVPLDRAQGVLKGPLERAQRALRDSAARSRTRAARPARRLRRKDRSPPTVAWSPVSATAWSARRWERWWGSSVRCSIRWSACRWPLSSSSSS